MRGIRTFIKSVFLCTLFITIKQAYSISFVMKSDFQLHIAKGKKEMELGVHSSSVF